MIECYLVDVEGTIVTDKSYTPIEGVLFTRELLQRPHSGGGIPESALGDWCGKSNSYTDQNDVHNMDMPVLGDISE